MAAAQRGRQVGLPCQAEPLGLGSRCEAGWTGLVIRVGICVLSPQPVPATHQLRGPQSNVSSLSLALLICETGPVPSACGRPAQSQRGGRAPGLPVPQAWLGATFAPSPVRPQALLSPPQPSPMCPQTLLSLRLPTQAP